MRHDIERYWNEVAAAIPAMPYDLLGDVADMLLACQRRGRTVFVLGNGGSAATASHFACDLAKGTRGGGPPAFRVMALTDNVPLLTAWANDTSFDRVFAEQLLGFAQPGDVVIAISASGNSPNVLAAIAAAREAGALVIAWTGATGGQLAALADITIHAPFDSIEQVEDAHLLIGHSLCVALRGRLHTRKDSRAIIHDVLAEQLAAQIGE